MLVGKKCRKCGIVKDIQDFYTDKSRKDMSQNACKDCSDARTKQYKNSYTRKGTWRSHAVLLRYGLTEVQYNLLFNKQEGKCAICKRPQIEFKRRFAVDEFTEFKNTKTPIIRELLCGPCNSGLGMFQDNIKCLEQAISYLKKWGTN
jgi:hypothetical protein